MGIPARNNMGEDDVVDFEATRETLAILALITK